MCCALTPNAPRLHDRTPVLSPLSGPVHASSRGRGQQSERFFRPVDAGHAGGGAKTILSAAPLGFRASVQLADREVRAPRLNWPNLSLWLDADVLVRNLLRPRTARRQTAVAEDARAPRTDAEPWRCADVLVRIRASVHGQLRAGTPAYRVDAEHWRWRGRDWRDVRVCCLVHFWWNWLMLERAGWSGDSKQNPEESDE